MNRQYTTVKFTVSGRVQGVFFRKHTASKAQSLRLTGWVRNTPSGTVEGAFEYEQSSKDKAEQFMHWLRNVGSPNCRIDGCFFEEEAVSAEEMRFDDFKIVR